MHIIASKLGEIISANDEHIQVDESFVTAALILYDAVYLTGGTNSSATLEVEANAVHFFNDAFKHCKAIAVVASAIQVIEATYFCKKLPAEYNEETVLREGIRVSNRVNPVRDLFPRMVGMHRFWEREVPRKIPA